MVPMVPERKDRQAGVACPEGASKCPGPRSAQRALRLLPVPSRTGAGVVARRWLTRIPGTQEGVTPESDRGRCAQWAARPATSVWPGWGWLGTGDWGSWEAPVPGGLGTDGLLGPPGCMLDPVPGPPRFLRSRRPASASVIALFHLMVCSSPGRSPEREKGHRPCQTRGSGNDHNAARLGCSGAKRDRSVRPEGQCDAVALTGSRSGRRPRPARPGEEADWRGRHRAPGREKEPGRAALRPPRAPRSPPLPRHLRRRSARGRGRP